MQSDSMNGRGQNGHAPKKNMDEIKFKEGKTIQKQKRMQMDGSV